MQCVCGVECLVLCLQLWLATSYSEIITKPMDNVVACEGGTGEFPWTDDTKNLYKVEYNFQTKIIAKSYGPNFSSVVYKDENLKSRLLIDDNVAFRIEHVTEKDRGEYKIVLTYIDGNRLKLVGSLDVIVPGCGKLNITRDPNKPNVFRCGEKTGSDLYTWVFTEATGVKDRNMKDSELTLDVLDQNGSFYCKRLSDCQRSTWFNFTSGIELGDYTITVTNTTEDCRTLKCGEPVGTNTKYEWSSKVDCKAEERNRTTTNTFELCLNNFNYSVKCQRDHDCTETPWQRFTPGQSERHRRERRTLDEQLVPCDEDTASGNLDDSSPITTGIAVAVAIAVIAVIAGIAISTVVIRRKLKSRAGRRSDSFKDKETCEQMNLNPIT